MSDNIGNGDPARSLALLWRTQERPTRQGKRGRPRKPELSVDRIVRTAIELADREGLTALSMRRVADEIGVGTMSLYTHIPGKPELVDVMVDSVYEEVLPSEPAADQASDSTEASDGDESIDPEPTEVAPDAAGWREKLELVARANWALHHRHPWMLRVTTTRPPLGPNLMAKYDHELRAVEGIGLSDVEMDSVLTLVLGHVHTSARRAVGALPTEEDGQVTQEQWWHAHSPLLDRIVDDTKHPVAARVGGTTGGSDKSSHAPDRDFEFGLQRILDGVEVFVDSHSAASA